MGTATASVRPREPQYLVIYNIRNHLCMTPSQVKGHIFRLQRVVLYRASNLSPWAWPTVGPGHFSRPTTVIL